MSKGKKQLIVFIIAAVLIAGLGGMYAWQSKIQREQGPSANVFTEMAKVFRRVTGQPEPVVEPEPTPEPVAEPIRLIERGENDLASVTFTAGGNELTLEAVFGAGGEGTIEEWCAAGEPDIELDQAAARDMVRAMTYLSVESRLLESTDDPAQFGIKPDEATAVATYTDGTQNVIHVGKTTNERNRYYLMLEGDPGVYLLYSYYGERYFYTMDNLIDRTLPEIVADNLEYILIQERGKEPLEFGFYGTSEEKQQLYEDYGMIYITMLNPYPGREMYYDNFERYVMEDFQNFTLGELAAANPADLAEYGLAEPSLELWMHDRDRETEFHLLFGDRVGDDRIYCKFMDKPSVFLADYAHVKHLYGINAFNFIERFIALVNIEECERITVDSADGRDYDISINHTVLPPEPDEGEGEKVIRPTVNGVSVQDSAFRAFYRQIIALSYDTEIETFTPEGEPELTITYHMIDKPDAEVRFYNYNANFYAVRRDDFPIQFVASKQSAELMFEGMLQLLAGGLDR